MEVGFRLLWYMALPAGLFLLVTVRLTLVYRDKTLLRFLGPLALTELFLLWPGYYRYQMDQEMLADITGGFLVLITALLLSLVWLSKRSMGPAALLAVLGIFNALLASAHMVIRDM